LRCEAVKIVIELQTAQVGGVWGTVALRGSSILRRSRRLYGGLRAGESYVQEGQREESGKSGSSHDYALILHQRGPVNHGRTASQVLQTFHYG
jgi:hypothetical protein